MRKIHLLLLLFSGMFFFSSAQSLKELQSYIPEKIKMNFKEPVTLVELDEKGRVKIDFCNQVINVFNICDIDSITIVKIDEMPCLRFRCRDEYKCLMRVTGQKERLWEDSFFQYPMISLKEAERLKKAFESYMDLSCNNDPFDKED